MRWTDDDLYWDGDRAASAASPLIGGPRAIKQRGSSPSWSIPRASRPAQGRFAVFANGKLLKVDFATQPLAHMWLHRHLCGNGQIIGYPQAIIEWIGASDQSRSAH